MIDIDRDLAFTGRVLDAVAVRSKVALHNLANQNVPGFKRYEVRFEELLRQAKEQGRELAEVGPEVARDESGAIGQNNVSLLEEVTLLDKVRLLHELFSRRAGSHFATLNKAILGR